MSAKGISGDSVEGDRYYTPRWVVRQMVDHVLPRAMERADLWWKNDLCILEPSSGPGVIVDALRAWRPRAHITTIDTDPTVRPAASDQHHTGDFLAHLPRSSSYDLACTNPPFTPALDFTRHLHVVLEVPVTVLLLRLAFLSSDERQDFLRARPPAFVDVLAHRPSFDLPEGYVLPHRPGKGKLEGRCGRCRLPEPQWGTALDEEGCIYKGGDSADYAWFTWVRGHRGPSALNVLPKVPLEERRPRAKGIAA